ncbi:MAG: heme o synthase [Deltaproteobacteria bacterium]|nr:heme o synthase [Deltaproteobacteria bacterium]
MNAYLSLTKPRISLLFAVTGVAAMLMEGSIECPFQFGFLVAAIFLTGGSANAFNQYFERDVDLMMERTALKRSLPLKKVSPRGALIFAIITGVIGVGLLWAEGSFAAFVYGVFTILFYSFYYTLWLKPRTPYNIVIGGIAGSTGPLIGWAAASGGWDFNWAPTIMFLIVFFWTPPHFWALALCCKEDYAKVNYPMLPLVKGDKFTRTQIVLYSFTLLPLTIWLWRAASLSQVYLILSSILGLMFIIGAIRLSIKKTNKIAWQFFGYSILYLMILFIAIIVDLLVA